MIQYILSAFVYVILNLDNIKISQFTQLGARCYTEQWAYWFDYIVWTDGDIVGLDHQMCKQLPDIPKVSCFYCSVFEYLFCITYCSN